MPDTCTPEDAMIEVLDDIETLHDIEAVLMLHPFLEHGNLARLLEGLDRIEARLNEPLRAFFANGYPDTWQNEDGPIPELLRGSEGQIHPAF